jgi:predicted NBD/HSP70 family sugar kinase
MEKLTLGIDIGGTKIAGGVVNRRGEVLHRLEIRTADRSSFGGRETSSRS